MKCMLTTWPTTTTTKTTKTATPPIKIACIQLSLCCQQRNQLHVQQPEQSLTKRIQRVQLKQQQAQDQQQQQRKEQDQVQQIKFIQKQNYCYANAPKMIQLHSTRLSTLFSVLLVTLAILQVEYAAAFVDEAAASTATTTNLAALKSIVRIGDGSIITRDAIEQSLVTVHDIATENLGTLCISTLYRPLQVPINSERYDSSRQKADLVASILLDVGIIRHGGLSDALAKGLLSDDYITSARILALNLTNGAVQSYVWWIKSNHEKTGKAQRFEEEGLQIGKKPAQSYPWFDDETTSPSLRSPKFTPSPPNIYYKGWWTYPYFSCTLSKWILSYSIAIPPSGRHGLRGFISIDIDVTGLRVNQCEALTYRFNYQQIQTRRLHLADAQVSEAINDLQAFHGSHKCHRETMMCDYRQPTSEAPTITTNKILTMPNAWSRGAYQCLCKRGYYSERHSDGFNGTIMEIAWKEHQDNVSDYYAKVFTCYKCAPGCDFCTGPEPCLADYNWPFRISLLTISIGCAIGTFILAGYLFRHRKVKVFKVASPIFLLITLIGCAIMYCEMIAIFPYLDTSWCIVTKWTRHMGFCITYTSLLMKTWRVSLTYRVKSAHKVKLTDKQLLQWMVPILLVMLIYLGTWTISDTPYAEFIHDQDGLKFKQCSYNWWDHSLAIGEVFFLAWGIRVCYNVRNAESLYNEARLISYAIYNIAIVNIIMIAFHLFIFPQAGPDIKYLLGFIRTQFSTTTTITLVFGPKISRVLKGQGDKWDQKAKVRSITASFSLNGVGLVPEDSPDLYQENEELKEQVQKLAHQIEFMKTVHMQMNNRHLKPKPGGYFTITSTSFQAPFTKNTMSTVQTQTTKCGISDDPHSSSNSVGFPTNLTPSKSKPVKEKV
ncbi:probable G-protein coupled receptor CG31760 [Teleopsis dalmanni]|uniref:probable G-protein coupled receptor CG31760 n=1 Tax=Teleopsis dalmanni TaxID=139649 RepID=UPI0018CEA3FA|nr:probable G-protein coupled receptor CG31760 [Teleopsis dalmanni]